MTALDQEAREALTRARMEEAQESLDAVNLLKDNGFYSIAMTRLYYACFYAASALLIHHNIYTKTHAGVKHKIHECFVAEGLMSKEECGCLSVLFEKRQACDYDAYVRASREEIEDFIPQAQIFIDAVKRNM